LRIALGQANFSVDIGFWALEVDRRRWVRNPCLGKVVAAGLWLWLLGSCRPRPTTKRVARCFRERTLLASTRTRQPRAAALAEAPSTPRPVSSPWLLASARPRTATRRRLVNPDEPCPRHKWDGDRKGPKQRSPHVIATRPHTRRHLLLPSSSSSSSSSTHSIPSNSLIPPGHHAPSYSVPPPDFTTLPLPTSALHTHQRSTHLAISAPRLLRPDDDAGR
jgi:hypothetical protein